MAFTLHVDTGNAAFYNMTGEVHLPGPELARILRKLAETLEHGTHEQDGLLRDVNGNRVGSWEITEREGY